MHVQSSDLVISCNACTDWLCPLPTGSSCLKLVMTKWCQETVDGSLLFFLINKRRKPLATIQLLHCIVYQLPLLTVGSVSKSHEEVMSKWFRGFSISRNKKHCFVTERIKGYCHHSTSQDQLRLVGSAAQPWSLQQIG